MKFLVWADKDNGKLSQLKESAGFFGIEPEPIGVGTKIDDTFKISSLYEAVCKLKDDEIVCATDGYDVFYQDNTDSIIEKFLSFDCDIVYSAERGYVHQYKRYKKYYDTIAGSSPYRYLNAGCVIGYAGPMRRIYKAGVSLRLKTIRAVIKTLQSIEQKIIPRKSGADQLSTSFLDWFYYNDQALAGKYIAQNPEEIRAKLDYYCKLFWCTSFEWEEIDKHYSVVDTKILNNNTDTSPSCIHVPWEKKYRHVFLNLYELSKSIRSATKA